MIPKEWCSWLSAILYLGSVPFLFMPRYDAALFCVVSAWYWDWKAWCREQEKQMPPSLAKAFWRDDRVDAGAIKENL